LIRAEVLSLKEKDYVLAARICGVSSGFILFYEILPNALYVATVEGSLRTATAILYEASLSFLGLGDPNLVSWGWIIRESMPFLRIAWWMPIFPGIVLSVLVIAINLVGDGLNDALNPQLKER
jgi:peptide/nickel transport system permease protein